MESLWKENYPRKTLPKAFDVDRNKKAEFEGGRKGTLGGERLNIRLPRISKYYRNERERIFWTSQKIISQTKPQFGTFWHGRVKNDNKIVISISTTNTKR